MRAGLRAVANGKLPTSVLAVAMGSRGPGEGVPGAPGASGLGHLQMVSSISIIIFIYIYIQVLYIYTYIILLNIMRYMTMSTWSHFAKLVYGKYL